MLLFRLLLGSVLIIHGWPKLLGGPERWEQLGGAVGAFGINFAPQFWGFMAMFSELVGGAMIILGFLYIPATILTAITMLVAMSFDAKGIKEGMEFFPAFRVVMASMTLFFLSIAALLMGPGKYSIDALICKKMCPEHDCGHDCHDGTCAVEKKEEVTKVQA